MKIPVGTLWVVPNGVEISEYVDIFLYVAMGEYKEVWLRKRRDVTLSMGCGERYEVEEWRD
jgi:hypothetical protein